MASHFKNKLLLLSEFYKSTLVLSIGSSFLIGVLGFMNLRSFFAPFGICLLSGGTVISLLHKEIAKQQEYYFYYNKGLSKLTLIVACVCTNLFIGVALIMFSIYGA